MSKIPSFRSGIIGTAMVAVMLSVLCLVSGCRQKLDSQLSEIDSIMESYPDTALMLLNDYRLSKRSTTADSAYYGLLLTHARYKNFIDENDDSLISRSVDYFVEAGDKEKAARSLFLQGMLCYNDGKLGESALCFRKGLDLAQEADAYMWEGQCAGGMEMIYSRLHDGSAQVDFATQAYEAFKKTNDDGWIDYSRYLLALAYNNNCRYEECLSELDALLDEEAYTDDSNMLSEMFKLKGLSLYALGRYQESLDAYSKAYGLNPSVLSDTAIRNIRIALAELRKDEITDSSYPDLENLCERNSSILPFVTAAEQGRYKEAYESLEAYKNRQDSVLSAIIRNNVSESVNQYNSMRSTRMKEKIRKERMSYLMIFLIVVTVGILIIWRIRERMLTEARARLRAEVSMESLRLDFLTQLEDAKLALQNASQPMELRRTEDFERVIRQHYADANRLCDDYYQSIGGAKDKTDGVDEDIHNIIRSFTEKNSFEKIEGYVDEKSGGLYSSFMTDFFHLSADSVRLFLYLMIGLSPRSLSVILGQNISSIYTKKSRLKTKIEQSDVARKSEYLKFF